MPRVSAEEISNDFSNHKGFFRFDNIICSTCSAIPFLLDLCFIYGILLFYVSIDEYLISLLNINRKNAKIFKYF